VRLYSAIVLADVAAEKSTWCWWSTWSTWTSHQHLLIVFTSLFLAAVVFLVQTSPTPTNLTAAFSQSDVAANLTDGCSDDCSRVNLEPDGGRTREEQHEKQEEEEEEEVIFVIFLRQINWWDDADDDDDDDWRRRRRNKKKKRKRKTN